MTDSNRGLMTVTEIADYLSLSRQAIYVLAQNDEIPAFKLGASWRFRKSDIDTWLETQRTGPEVAHKQPMVDVREPPLTKKEIEAFEAEQRVKLIDECVRKIEFDLLDDTRSVFPLSNYLDNFGTEIVKDAIRQLEKQKRVKVGRVKNEKVLERRT